MDKSEREKLRHWAEEAIGRGGLRADATPAGEITILATGFIDLLDHIDALERQVQAMHTALVAIENLDMHSMYQRDIDCDFPTECRISKTCKAIPRSNIGKLAQAAIASAQEA